jgi:hypothetical protein
MVQERTKKNGDYKLYIRQNGRLIGKHYCEGNFQESIPIDYHIECQTEGTLQFELHKRSPIPLIGEFQKTKYTGQCRLEEIVPAVEGTTRNVSIDLTGSADRKSSPVSPQSKMTSHLRLLMETALHKH